MNGEARESKWQRARNPRPIFLQERDQRIVSSVYEFGFLTRHQIQRLFDFNCVTRVNIRLRMLFDHSYLSRRFLPAIKGSSQALYFLGPQGVDLISQRIGIDPAIIKKKQRNYYERKELFLDHDLLLNDVRIGVYEALRKLPDTRLDQWVSYTDCLQEWNLRNPKTGCQSKAALRPDGYFRYFSGDKLFGCFLEVDRSTMSNSRFQSKVKLYLEYIRSGLYPSKYGLQFFRVLVVTETRQRLLNLKTATAQLTDRIFWFARADRLREGSLFDQIWERPGKPGTFSLLE
ncbi:MAG: hypothetical protein A4E62_00393 [Syntrophorhabdus sp. PtaU1.Bin002]|nr:MAG: hypothetical protein A4E62_00393 [Syntrophorhabdus sp. PtaU1.Bin002]